MRLTEARLVASPTDLANFLVCAHKTSLDLLVAEGRLAVPAWIPSDSVDRGEEQTPRRDTRADGLRVADPNDAARDERPERTIQHARRRHRGGALVDGDWLGYATLSARFHRRRLRVFPEAHDTAPRDARWHHPATLRLFGSPVGRWPRQSASCRRRPAKRFTRVADFAAFYRQIARFRGFVESMAELRTAPYPNLGTAMSADGCRCKRAGARR